MKNRSRTALLSVALLLTGLASAVPAQAEERPAIDAQQQDRDISIIGDIDSLNHQEQALYYSDKPKSIQLDASSGDVISVVELTDAQLKSLIQTEQAKGRADALSSGISPMSVSLTGCPSTSLGCWYGVGPVHHYQYTLGTTSGTWGNRQNFYTGAYYAKLCWLDTQSNPFNPPTYCMPERNGKNAMISLGMAVTGKQVNLSTTR